MRIRLTIEQDTLEEALEIWARRTFQACGKEITIEELKLYEEDLSVEFVLGIEDEEDEEDES